MTYLDYLDLHAEMALGRLNAAAKKTRQGPDALTDAMKAILREAYEAGREAERGGGEGG